jgi:antitoxin component YwqK of YwqJK toxin-antitoxin module
MDIDCDIRFCRSLKTITSVIILLLSINVLCAQSPQKIYWENGVLRAEGQANDMGARVGQWKYYYSSGEIEAVGSYNGQKVSAVNDPFKRPKTSAVEDQTSKSARNGEWNFYYKNGMVSAKIFYQNGCPYDKAYRYHPNGIKAEEATLKDCALYAPRTMWDQKGVKYFETKIESPGKTSDYEYYPSGQIKSIVPYKDGEQYGVVKRYFENGNREEDVMMKNNKVNGSYRSWYSNGKKQREFFSINNVMSGEFREWNESGVLLRETIQDAEIQRIIVKTYWENGQLKMKGTSKTPPSHSIHHWAQSRHGAWTYWDKNGNVQKTENYIDGKLVSTDLP